MQLYKRLHSLKMNTKQINALVQLKAFARIAGLKMMVVWAISFACFVAQFHTPGFSMLWLVSVLAIPYIMTRQTRSYRDNIGGALTFRRSWLFSVYTFFYASILFALAQYVHFAFIDHGFIISQYISTITAPAGKALLTSYGYSQNDLKMIINQLEDIKPITIAINCATMNILAGCLLALPIAALTKRTNI